MVQAKRLERKTTELNDYSSVSKGGRGEAKMTQRFCAQKWIKNKNRKNGKVKEAFVSVEEGDNKLRHRYVDKTPHRGILTGE